VDPLKALEAHMDGYRVSTCAEAARHCDVWITVTGDLNVIDKAAFDNMKSGAIICNSGHFNSEINIPWLEANCVVRRELKPLVVEYGFADGRKVILLAEGRLINLSAAEGHPAEVMDMSFANQALCVEHMLANAAALAPGVYPVPAAIDEDIARLKLASLDIVIDTLTEEQRQYLASWQMGTV
jgi:adenosylhomocysteinase